MLCIVGHSQTAACQRLTGAAEQVRDPDGVGNDVRDVREVGERRVRGHQSGGTRPTRRRRQYGVESSKSRRRLEKHQAALKRFESHGKQRRKQFCIVPAERDRVAAFASASSDVDELLDHFDGRCRFDVASSDRGYCMSMFEHRLQILLDDERHRRITAVARERGVSVATVVREAIDRGLASLTNRRKSAGQRLLDASDMPVPDLPELKEELDALRARRG